MRISGAAVKIINLLTASRSVEGGKVHKMGICSAGNPGSCLANMEEGQKISFPANIYPL